MLSLLIVPSTPMEMFLSVYEKYRAKVRAATSEFSRYIILRTYSFQLDVLHEALIEEDQAQLKRKYGDWMF
jgi:hypothetical protein